MKCQSRDRGEQLSAEEGQGSKALMWRAKAKGNVDKMNRPYHLQHTDKHLKWAECKFLQEAPKGLHINPLLKGKTTFVTTAGLG